MRVRQWKRPDVAQAGRIRVVDGARLCEPQGGGAKDGPESKTELRSWLEWLWVADLLSGHSLVPDNSERRPRSRPTYEDDQTII